MAYALENNWNVTQIILDAKQGVATFPHATLRLRSAQVTPIIPTRPPRFLKTSVVFISPACTGNSHRQSDFFVGANLVFVLMELPTTPCDHKDRLYISTRYHHQRRFPVLPTGGAAFLVWGSAGEANGVRGALFAGCPRNDQMQSLVRKNSC